MKRSFWDKIRGRVPTPAEPGPPSSDILEIARSVENIVDDLSSRVFSEFGPYLLTQDITFIVPAIWGAAHKAELTEVQKTIYKSVAPDLERAFTILDLASLNPAQDFAIGYLLRSLVVTKIVYMVEACKRRQVERQAGNQDANSLHGVSLLEVEPAGQA